MQGHSQRTSHKPSNRFLLLLGWFIIPSLFCGLPYAFADHPFQVGIIDPQAVMENSNSGQKALATLKEHIAVRQKLLEADEQELQKLEQQFQNGSDRSETETQFMQEQIQNKIQDYQRRAPNIPARTDGKAKKYDDGVHEKNRGRHPDRSRTVWLFVGH